MSFLVTDTTVRFFDAKAITLNESVPIGIYKLNVEQTGVYLSEYDYTVNQGRIYGDAESIANHIVESYTRPNQTKNLGVLLSGEKGLGKTLTIKLVIEKLKKKYPIIFINDYFGNAQLDFLMHLSNCVVIFDEFDKTHRGSVNEESTDNTITKQESLLTVLDGTNKESHNLYLLSCNNAYALNENLISRPSRIRYHYKYETLSQKDIEDYCKDNLVKKELQAELVDSLLCNRFVSFDIVQTVVQELNDFDVSVEQVMKYMNLDVGELNVTFRISFQYADQEYVVEKDETDLRLTSNSNQYFGNVCPACPKDVEKGFSEVFFYLRMNLKEVKIPLYGYLDITNRVSMVNNGYFKDFVKITKVEVRETMSAIDSRLLV